MSPDDARALPRAEFQAYLKLMPRIAAAEARWLNTIDKGDPKDVDAYLSYLASGGDPGEYGAVRARGQLAIDQFKEMVGKGARK